MLLFRKLKFWKRTGDCAASAGGAVPPDPLGHEIERLRRSQFLAESVSWTDLLLAPRSILVSALLGAFSTALCFALLLYVSYRLTGKSWNFLQPCFVAVFRFEDLSPTLSLWWYLFTEMFPRFRPLFQSVFHCHIFVYVLPIHLLLSAAGVRSDVLGTSPASPGERTSGERTADIVGTQHRLRAFGSLAATVATFGVIAFFRPYPTAVDWCTLVSLICVFSEDALPSPLPRLELKRDVYVLVNEKNVASDAAGAVGRRSQLVRLDWDTDTLQGAAAAAKPAFTTQKRIVLALAFAAFGLSMHPVMATVWLFRNTGNANFLFFMQLL